MVICIKNSSPRGRPSIQSSAVTVWSIWERTFSEGNCGAWRLGFFTKNNIYCFHTHPIYRFNTCRLSTLRQGHGCQDPEQIAEGTQLAFRPDSKSTSNAVQGDYFEEDEIKTLLNKLFLLNITGPRSFWYHLLNINLILLHLEHEELGCLQWLN